MGENKFNLYRQKLVESLEKQEIIKTEQVKNAMLKVPREQFVWEGNEYVAYNDSPQSLGDTEQTISAPHMIAIMLEEMNLKPGLKILEVGTGSGYNAALMAEIIKTTDKNKKGEIISIERVNDLVEFATANIKRTNYSDIVSIHMGDGTLGYPKKSVKETYDRIMVTAAAPHVPKYLLKQLKKGGLLMIPVGRPFVQNLIKISKDFTGKISKNSVVDCVFVPLLGEDGYN